MLHDPGKQVFYYTVLHYYTRIFGLSEISLRSTSVIFSLMTLALMFALGVEMFDNNTALAAAAIWAFNPLAVVFAHTARMYPMLVALALAQLLTLWRVRMRPSVAAPCICGITGAALLYTHLGGIMFLGAAVAMLVRDYIRGQRNPMAWLAMAITLALFVPYVPIARAQSETLLAGHWLDWIGTAYEYPLRLKIVTASGAAAVAYWFVLGASARTDSDDQLALDWRVDHPAGTRARGRFDRDSSDVQRAVRRAVDGHARIADRCGTRAGERQMAQSAGAGGFRWHA